MSISFMDLMDTEAHLDNEMYTMETCGVVLDRMSDMMLMQSHKHNKKYYSDLDRLHTFNDAVYLLSNGETESSMYYVEMFDIKNTFKKIWEHFVKFLKYIFNIHEKVDDNIGAISSTVDSIDKQINTIIQKSNQKDIKSVEYKHPFDIDKMMKSIDSVVKDCQNAKIPIRMGVFKKHIDYLAEYVQKAKSSGGFTLSKEIEKNQKKLDEFVKKFGTDKEENVLHTYATLKNDRIPSTQHQDVSKMDSLGNNVISTIKDKVKNVKSSYDGVKKEYSKLLKEVQSMSLKDFSISKSNIKTFSEMQNVLVKNITSCIKGMSMAIVCIMFCVRNIKIIMTKIIAALK